MFLIVPLSLILISIVGILVIVLRKKSYLNKLYTLNTAGTDGNGPLSSPIFSWKAYGDEFYPEISLFLKRLRVHEYKGAWLMEIEKFLRKSRVLFLKFDRISDSMIKRIRKIHVNDKLILDSVKKSSAKPEMVVESLEQETKEVEEKKAPMSMAFLKNEEQRLIMEIAKNPKDSKLYESLGDLYMEMSNFIDAKESYEAAIELDEKNESLKHKLSSALEKTTPQN